MFRKLGRFIFICSLLCWIGIKSINAQERGKLFSKYYSPIEYDFGTQNWDIHQDKNNIIYVGNQMGLLQFDGTNWKIFYLPNQSTVDRLKSLTRGKL